MEKYIIFVGLITSQHISYILSSSCPDKCHCTVDRVKCLYTKITLWEIEQKLCEHARDITELYLMGNRLNDSSIRSLSCFKNLKLLQLSYNVLSKFPNELVKNLTRLENLYLTSNQIRHLPEFISNTSLKVLYLDNNELSEIPENVFTDTKELRELYLNKNEIETLKADSFQGLKLLEKLYLNNNKLKQINKDTFKSCHNLKEIYLQSNRLSDISANIFRTNSQLKRIFLHENVLENVIPTLFDGLSLEKLYLNGNKFKTLNANLFYHTKSIDELYTYNNPLKCSCDLIKFKKRYIKKFLKTNGRMELGYCKYSETLRKEKISKLSAKKLNCSACEVAICSDINKTCIDVNGTYECRQLTTGNIVLSTSKPEQTNNIIASQQQSKDTFNDVIIIVSILVALGLLAFAVVAVFMLYRTKKQKFSFDEGESVLASTADLSVTGSIKLESLTRKRTSECHCNGVDHKQEEKNLMIPKIIIT